MWRYELLDVNTTLGGFYMLDIETRLKEDREKWLSRRAKIQSQVEHLQADIESLTRQIDYVNGLLVDSGKSPEIKGNISENSDNLASLLSMRIFDAVDPSKIRSKTNGQIIEMVLREERRPMRVMEIVKRAVQMGYAKPEREQRLFANFSSLLSHSLKEGGSAFRRHSRGLYMLARTEEPAT